MKYRFALFACLIAFSLTVGCDSGEPTNLAGEVSDSEIEEYNRMLQESQKQMVESDEAMKKEMKPKR
ncbi:MAG TPA: hypothetical protein DDX19_09330 [Rhodopirellula baltica]|uniref:Secreted protein n=1 Tax=Rhodopirellula baltica (strain DSM 10527 / NCIMB 13988 / SH1) TaxID=243090 RepID=Q7UU35_RHOBA|nr:hypothetical protein [Rhodopirellula baltica]CAD73249.1 hypothetical protein RB3539 [Rhodopirellula baltica SH 1]HBE62926.1 hypothetical protein [Rhodopirellula baltica]